MFAPVTDVTDRLAGPYTLGASEFTDRLADALDAPHLVRLLMERFGFGTEPAAQAATAVTAALHETWQGMAYGEDYATWIRRMPETLLKCFVDLAVRAEDNELTAEHELRVARQMLAELAIVIRHR
ncbi:hypothetical protein [Streptomyces sp. NPDC026673]|uniref:hypothetical protein n=1 Tax=Streptomyces sp. NPDC026673 TaxID=3155724 RepID=UPI0033DB0D8D